ncbi:MULTISPECIES: hypothetical protein [unclassified Coleofasciculus]|nr:MULTISPECIES: hypothetical protein [unclassified Coleofasciculus]
MYVRLSGSSVAVKTLSHYASIIVTFINIFRLAGVIWRIKKGIQP